MTETVTVPEATTAQGGAGATSRGRRWIPPVSMLLLTWVCTLLPLRNVPTFYYWDDTVGAAVGVWQRIAREVLGGTFPGLQLDMWRGGNLPAEAATGVWNPVMLGLMLGTYPLDDLNVAVIVAKLVLFGILAGGVYLLARELRASPWMAAVAGLALSVTGYTLYMDGTSWVNGLAISAFTPWMWWAVRRHAYGRGSVAWAFLTGYLLVSTGNPYGMLALGAVLAAVGVEMLCVGRARRIWWLAAQLLVALLAAVVVYAPFLLTAEVGTRAGSRTGNDEFFAVGLSDLLGMSTPLYQPYIRSWGPFMTYPGVYLAWFALPLVPWLRWGVLRSRWRELSGAIAFGAFYLLLVLGPSQVWMFRWPARLLPFLWLALMLVLVVVLTQGLRDDKRAARWSVTGVLVLLGAWQAYSDRPDNWKWVGLGVLLVAALTYALVRTGRRATALPGFAVMALGTVLVLLAQTTWMPIQGNTRDYRQPTSRSEIEATVAERGDGLTVQVVNVYAAPPEWAQPDALFGEVFMGNMFSVSGHESTTAYSGIGFTAHDQVMCFNHHASTCPELWDRLWEVPDGEDASLADLLGARIVVVQNEFVPDLTAPPGWSVTDETEFVTVFTRDEPSTAGTGRPTVVGDGVDVVQDEMLPDGVGERLVVSTGDASTARDVTFGRLAWPGYTVTVGGEPVPVETGPAGLLRVDLPAGLDDQEVVVAFTSPGWKAGLLSLGAAGALAVLLSVLDAVQRRRSRRDPAPVTGERTS